MSLSFYNHNTTIINIKHITKAKVSNIISTAKKTHSKIRSSMAINAPAFAM